ncbi:acyltransferase [Chryseobacterium aquaticum]|uniref:Acetyltransferase n=2 Tax=Chryseobacterium aquaticum TaxID=452084 RepID=A0A101CL69_9FLAO|nr:acyltransferase [Chryseobacterium aquaticum]KQK27502.1 acetyltransferase [Chryseobacterium aquaticum]KUJ58257.1 acetyltransferase [Chryseobacterium aquaticum subsp. greenlandense]
MNTVVLHIYNNLAMFLPETKFFRFKNFLLKFAGVKIGKNVRICSSAKILGNGTLSIGNDTWIGHQCLIISSSNISIGSNIDIAPRVYIGTGTHIIDLKSDNIAGEGLSKDIIIGSGSWIGVNTTILPGVAIGEKNIIAAGSVVAKSTESNNMYGGVPTKLIKNLF